MWYVHALLHNSISFHSNIFSYGWNQGNYVFIYVALVLFNVQLWKMVHGSRTVFFFAIADRWHSHYDYLF